MFNIAIQYGDRYQLAIVSGVAGAAEFCAAHSFVSEWALRTHCTRLLVDLLGVTSTMDADGEQALSQHLWQSMPAYEKLAIVAHSPAGYRFIQEVAGARGVRMREFSDLQAAEAWLIEC